MPELTHYLYRMPISYLRFGSECAEYVAGHLVMSCNTSLFVELIDFLLTELSKNSSTSTTRTYIQCVGTIRWVNNPRLALQNGCFDVHFCRFTPVFILPDTPGMSRIITCDKSHIKIFKGKIHLEKNKVKNHVCKETTTTSLVFSPHFFK